MRTVWRWFWSNAPETWLGMPAFMRVIARAVVIGALAFLLYHTFTGTL